MITSSEKSETVALLELDESALPDSSNNSEPVAVGVNEQELAKYMCNICSELLYEPVVLPSCGHSCCSHCLRTWIHSGGKKCPAGCQTLLSETNVPATCVFLKNDIKERFPDLYAGRKKEVEKMTDEQAHDIHPLMRQSFNPLWTEKDYLSTTHRANKNLKDSLENFWSFNWFWRRLLLFAAPLILICMASPPEALNATLTLQEFLKDYSISEEALIQFEKIPLQTFARFDSEEAFSEFGISDYSDVKNLHIAQQDVARKLDEASGFWAYREHHQADVDYFLLIGNNWHAGSAVALWHGILDWNYTNLAQLILVPQGLHYQFLLKFAHTNPIFVFMKLYDTISFICDVQMMTDVWHQREMLFATKLFLQIISSYLCVLFILPSSLYYCFWMLNLFRLFIRVSYNFGLVFFLLAMQLRGKKEPKIENYINQVMDWMS